MDGPGKVAKVRKHQGSRTPYARPARRTAALEAVTPGAGVNVDDSEEPQPHSSLLASVLTAATTPLRAAASLITKVPIFNSYLTASGTLSRDGLVDVQADENGDVSDIEQEGIADYEEGAIQATGSVDSSQLPLAKVQLNHKKENSKEANGPQHLAFTSDDKLTVRDQQKPKLRGQEEGVMETDPSMKSLRQENVEEEPTPYDDILRRLRNGPLAASTPPFHSGEPPSFTFRSLAPAAGGMATRPASRLGPNRTGFKAKILPTFQSIRPVEAPHGTPTTHGPLATSMRFNRLSQPLTQQVQASPWATNAEPLQLTPLSWTPLKSGATPMTRSLGSKRKVPDSGYMQTPGSISLLDAARRSKVQRGQVSTPATEGPKERERRSWLVGRTPYRTGSQTRDRFGSAMKSATAPIFTPQAEPTKATPGSKPTSDTARKILETLELMDQSLSGKKSPKEIPSAVQVSPSPPTQSLTVHAPTRRPRVTFAELTEYPEQEGKALEKLESAAKKFESRPSSSEEMGREKRRRGNAVEAGDKARDLVKEPKIAEKETRGIVEKQSEPVYVFGNVTRNPVLANQIKEAAKTPILASTRRESDPVYYFGSKKKEEAAKQKTQPRKREEEINLPKAQEEANRLAQEAAKSPLPPVDEEFDVKEEEEADAEMQLGIIRKRPDTKKTDTKDVQQVEGNAPLFSFASTSPHPKKGVPVEDAPAIGDEEKVKEEGKGEQAAPTFAFTFAAVQPTSAPPPTPLFSLGSKGDQTEEKRTADKPQEGQTVQTNGWGDAFLKANKEHATATAQAVEKEVEASKGGQAATQSAPQPAPQPVTFNFGFGGIPQSSAPPQTPSITFGTVSKTDEHEGEARTTVPAVPAFTFGAPEQSTEVEKKVEKLDAAAPVFSFGPKAVADKTGMEAPSLPSFLLPTKPEKPATESEQKPEAAPKVEFKFGQQVSAPSAGSLGSVPTPASVPAPETNETQATTQPSFSFGASASGQSQSGFIFGASSAEGLKSSTAELPSFGASSSTGAGAFTFGATSSTPSAPAASPMEQNNNASEKNTTDTNSTTPSPSGFAFGAGATGFGASSQPAFGGGFGQTTLGASQPASFGATGFGNGNTSGFGLASFGSGQPATPGAFGAPQQPPGPMIPNPFGGGMPPAGFGAGSSGGGGAPQGGGAFSMGSMGNSQSEGRRKVRVRRPR